MAYQGVFGCFFVRPAQQHSTYSSRHYLPQVELNAHTTIRSTASRTKLRQTFTNNTSANTPEVQYTFPLYDGVSVVSFKCTIDKKVIFGVVKEKNEARTQYKEAIARGESAGLLEQMYEASDVFSTKIGNISKDGKAVVEIEYVGELKHDAQADGVRFSIPTSIAPRYGTLNHNSQTQIGSVASKLEIVVDVEVDEGAQIEGLSSPTHPIAMTVGRISTRRDAFKSNRASATLSLGTAELGNDFIIVVNAQDHLIPRALLEEHPDIPKHKAMMTTLVPRFNLPNINPEIVFIVDRSGSMAGKIPTLVQALKIFLKSLPLSAKFNICSFGSSFTLLFPQSVPYDERTLQHALSEVDRFDANYGGTELLQPIKEVVRSRLAGIPLEIMVLTDGEIWNQQEAFDFVNDAAKSSVRLFSLGIGTSASTSLVEGLARAGNGFAQFVQDNEKIDKRVIRMLKAALSPHITDYRLELKYEEDEDSSDEDFEMVESTTITDASTPSEGLQQTSSQAATISLFDPNFKESKTNPSISRYDHLPKLTPPKILQAPNEIHGLFPYNRTSAYLLLPDSTRKMKSVMLRGTYNNGPVQLEIPIQKVGLGKTIHQLAAKSAMLETEEGRGWLSSGTTSDGTLFKTKYIADWDRLVEQEAVRLGVKFQVAGKFCSFVAVESDSDKGDKVLHVPESQPKPTPSYASSSYPLFSGFAAPTVSARQIHGTHSLFYSGAPSPGGPTSNSASTGLSPSRPSSFRSSLFGNSSASGSNVFGGPPPSGQRASAQAATNTQWQARTAQQTQMHMPPQQTQMQRQQIAKGSVATSSGLFGTSTPAGYGAQGVPARRAQMPQQQASLFGGSASTGTSLFGKSSNSKSFAGFGSSTGFNAQTNAQIMPSPMSFGGPARASQEQKATQPSTNLFGCDQSTNITLPDSIETKMYKIIGLQQFDGSWMAQDELLKFTDVWKADFADTNIKYEDETVRATILAIAWLEKQAASDAEVWDMVVEKAKQWLATKHGITDAEDAVRMAIAVFFP